MPTRVCKGARVVLQITYGGDKLQPSTHGPLCIVLMGLRVAKVHKHAVAHVLRNEPAEPPHSLSDALLIGGNNLAEVLGVRAPGERRRTDKVGEHHRNLPTLGDVM